MNKIGDRSGPLSWVEGRRGVDTCRYYVHMYIQQPLERHVKNIQYVQHFTVELVSTSTF